ncbi:SMI1/KNR4 family protein [Micromonospora psammae]|uniref:SMI1/KNR4 family protein n=1 Tax=Micromonospora sp. CPCC 205556 TaxID=3122398 RepID=UPI002FF0E44D
MTDRFDVGKAMLSGIGGRAEAWCFIRAFAAEWTRPLRDGDGVDDEELRDAEQALGFELPAALREAYLLFGRRDDLTRNQDRLLPPRVLEVDESGEVLVFRDENQGVASWGIPLAHIAELDPPVVMEHGEGWRPFLDRVSLACVEMVLTEVLFGSECLENAAELPAELIGVVEANYQRVNFPEYPMWSEPEEPVRWFSAPGQLLRLDGVGEWAWLFVRGRTADDLRRIYGLIPGTWTLGNALL